MIHKNDNQSQPVSDLLMELLVCPSCKGDLLLKDRDDEQVLVCEPCRLAFPISEGIPVMLIEKATRLA